MRECALVHACVCVYECVFNKTIRYERDVTKKSNWFELQLFFILDQLLYFDIEDISRLYSITGYSL